MAFLPITREECERLGWDAPDFVLVVGEAYVDHPSFGQAIISRVLEHAGYRVAMLCLPDYHTDADFKRFGRPKLGFLVTAGVIDSMVNHYTVAKKRRNSDVYAPGGQPGMRPDRATTVYCNRVHQAYPNVPVIIGGVEASLRRFSHYDYWDDKVRRSILVDTAATLLLYGMGERAILDSADWLRRGMPQSELRSLRGCCYMAKEPPQGAILLPSHAEVVADKHTYAKAFMAEYDEQDAVRGHCLCQQQDTVRFVVQNEPAMPLSRGELDAVYALPYERSAHPVYDRLGGVAALAEVRFSISATRGCFGSCNFCALTFHQGRVVTSRSEDSIVNEAQELTTLPDFKGYIHDIGGPTANFRAPACEKQLREGCCKNRQCLFPTPCKNLRVSHDELIGILRRVRSLPRVKKVFIRSGIRFDYLMADNNPTFLRELCEHHISGQLKVAPEHISPAVLDKMGKPRREIYDAFVQKYEDVNRRLGLKQYLVPYLMSSHPGCTLADAILLAEYLRDTGHQPEQVQDFYPTPGTLSTCMYYTGLDPRAMKPVYVPKTQHEKAMQRALMQWRNPVNHPLIREALRLSNREDLIGFGRDCLVPPREIRGGRGFGGADRGASVSRDPQRGYRTAESGRSRRAEPRGTADSQNRAGYGGARAPKGGGRGRTPK
ncbi:MAG TPA: YgiQ family radical SAM protein [Candidatus Limiplasma sp.]|nr:YgiQ family radical SAM protein [Candidatus Limiplasma sp.]HPS81222.1 YgiQ family radical SAM protein [Candidatus Limiplasma sp.]